MYNMTDIQHRQLKEEGYALLENAIPQDLIDQWRDIAERYSTMSVSGQAAGKPLQGACVVEDPSGPRLMRMDDLFYNDAEALLDLLATPAMMAIAREFCGRGCIPVQSDLLFKHQHPHPVINWHQGPQHARTHPYFNIGIYLDDANEDDGCLRYVPGTQFEKQDIYRLANEHGWDLPNVVQQPAKAGDILVQDMMVLHGSEPKRSPGARRTVYVEYRPAAAIRQSGEHSETWVKLRESWMSLIIARAADEDWPADWRHELPPPPHPKKLAEEISKTAEPVLPAYYGYPVAETDNYPVPADLRS